MAIDYSTYKFLKVEVEDGVATVTLNRPEAMNAVPQWGSPELHRIFADLGEDEAVRAVIVTGAGRAFCAGGDIKRMDADSTQGTTQSRRVTQRAGGSELLENILGLDKPIIAAVNGPAIGLGATLALFSDIIIAAETARFGDTHVRVGVVAGDGGTVIWPLLLGPAKAKELLMTGDIIDAKEAERIGLVNKVVPLADLMPAAKELAKRLAQGATLAIAGTKHSINKKIKQDLNLLIDASLASEMLTFLSEDHREAAKAFVEKRAPQFKGR